MSKSPKKLSNGVKIPRQARQRRDYMKPASVTYHRRSIRLKGYDYSSAGAYFVTICTQNRECLFGEVVDEEMSINEIGTIVQAEWMRTADIRSNVLQTSS